MTAADPSADRSARPDPAEQGGPGRTTITPRVVEWLAVAAAREADGSTRARARDRGGLTGLVRGRLPRASAVVAGQTSRIEVQVAAPWPESLAGVAARVRDHVGSRVAELAGVDVTAVDVVVAEIVTQRDLSPRVQ
ncbi:Asp23/Gls24 family envelope stress response protein [Nocardioides marmoraquaticus]